MHRKPTITDIARKAGVSEAVVSVVANGKENGGIFVSQKKKDEILALIEKYLYVPRKSARELSLQKTNSIGVICHSLAPYFSNLIEEMQKQALEKSKEIVTYIAKGMAEEEEYLNIIRDGRVDGVIILSINSQTIPLYRKFSASPYNYHFVGITHAIPYMPTVHFDEEEAGRLAAKHLEEIGCKRPCFFGGGKESLCAKGFVDYFKAKRTSAPLVFMDENFVQFFDEGRTLAEKLLRLPKIPDGVFAFNDHVAAALITKALELKISIPKDMAVLGCDNTEICRYTYPNLTSIEINYKLIVKAALAKMFEMIDGKKVEILHTKTPVDLAVRGSTEKKD